MEREREREREREKIRWNTWHKHMDMKRGRGEEVEMKSWKRCRNGLIVTYLFDLCPGFFRVCKGRHIGNCEDLSREAVNGHRCHCWCWNFELWKNFVNLRTSWWLFIIIHSRCEWRRRRRRSCTRIRRWRKVRPKCKWRRSRGRCEEWNLQLWRCGPHMKTLKHIHIQRDTGKERDIKRGTGSIFWSHCS